MKTKWKKIVTREIPLFQIFYSNKGYVKLKEILGFGFGDSLAINKNGVMERYLEERGLQRFYNTLQKLIERKKEKIFFESAFQLDWEIKEIIKKLQKVDLKKLTSQKLLIIFSDFDKKFSDYWTYYLAVFYLGDALDGTKYEKELKKYKKEIDVLRGEKSARFVAEQVFAPKLFAEIGQRAKIEPSLLFFAFPKEVIAFLKDRSPISERKLKERKVFYIWLLKGDKENYYTGVKAKQIVKKELREEAVDYSKVKELKGRVACQGRVRGQVTILMSSEDVPKMKKGNILVVPMTNPNYLSAMRCAAAFVTDEGGIMCHAAIVARELKKPCVIGTKIATKVLKDGDLVEVDADKGIVRKIN